jgi:hypothetical protein
MILKKDGTQVALESGSKWVTATYTPADRGPGLLKLQFQDQATWDIREADLRLDPWIADAYDLYEWRAARACVLSGAMRIVVLDLDTLRTSAAICLEVGEGETIERPRFVETDDGRRLLVATESRVFCLDETRAIRWCWSVRSRDDGYVLHAAPQIVGGSVHVQMMRIDAVRTVLLSLEDAVEQPR